LTPAQAAPALEILHRLAALVPADNLGWNPILAADALASDDNPFLYCPLLFGYSNYSRRGFRGTRVKYADIPAGPLGVSGSLLGGAGIAVSAFSRHPEEAIDHAFWLDSADVQRGVYWDGGGQSGNAVAWDDDRTNADSLDFFRGTRSTLEGAYLRPRHPRYIDLQDAVSPLVTMALAGEITDEWLVRRLNDAAARFLGDGPRKAEPAASAPSAGSAGAAATTVRSSDAEH
jgi:multiple sugar transport system substrate-binding protein